MKMTWQYAVFYFVLSIITTIPSFAQDSKWEIGIGLRPLNLQDDPYTIIVKRHLSPRVGLRLGLSSIFEEKDKYIEYIHPYHDDIHTFSYEYTRVEKKLYANSFLGIQYNLSKHVTQMKQNHIYCYALSDFSFKYQLERVDIPKGIYHPRSNLQPGDVFLTAVYGNTKTFILGLRQGLGIYYYLNSSISLALEGSIYYEIITSTEYKNTFEYSRSAPPLEDRQAFGSTKYLPKRINNYRWGFSPLTFLSIHHKF